MAAQCIGGAASSAGRLWLAEGPGQPRRQQHVRSLQYIRCSSASPATDAGGSAGRSAGGAPPAQPLRKSAARQPGVGSGDSSRASSSVSSSAAGTADQAAAGSSCRVRPAETSDYWAIADVHACAFYPRATPFWFAALRLDRVMSLQVGTERQQGSARFLCLVAEGGDDAGSSGSEDEQDVQQAQAGASMPSSSSSSTGGEGQGGKSGGVLAQAAALSESAAVAARGGGSRSPSSSSRPGGGANSRRVALRDFHTPVGAAADGVDLGPLVGALVNTVFPPSMRQNYAASYNVGGLRGAVVVDTLGEFVPPKKKRMPNGTIREVPRPRIAYLSNLAVAPCTRRSGIGQRLVKEAEQVAAEWGCLSVALHVDPANTPAVEMYRRAGYRRIADQSECQRILEGRSRPLVLMMRALPSEQRQLAQRRWQQLQQQAAEEAAAAAAKR